jgi:hypothetical protein
MSTTALKLSLLLASLLLPRLEAASVLSNGEFTGSLAGWSVTGTVFNTADAAVLTDVAASPVAVFQTGGLPTGTYELQLAFDFRNGLSPTVAGGFLRDTFFATLYYGRQPFGSSLAGGVFEQVLGLFDVDANGAFNVAPGASFGPSPKGLGWTRYTLTHLTNPAFAEPGFATVAFEFYNLNGIGADSVMAVDNVALVAVVPEPGAAALLLVSATLLARLRLRPKTSRPKTQDGRLGLTVTDSLRQGS